MALTTTRVRGFFYQMTCRISARRPLLPTSPRIIFNEAKHPGITNPDNFVSLLYYFGMLTISGMYEGKTKLTIPNQVVREQIYTYLLSTYDEADLSFSGYEKNELPAPLPTTLTGKPISVILPTA